MQLNTVIFDIDGLLINSEPLWNQAAAEIFAGYGVHLTLEAYATTTGLRTKEFVAWWLSRYGQDPAIFPQVEKEIVELRKKLRDAEMERDILKKAVSIFSRSDRKNLGS